MVAWISRQISVVMAVLCAIPSLAIGSSPLDFYPPLMDTLMVGDLAAAEQICDQIDADFPGHPAVIYGRACVLYSRATDLEDTTGRARFYELCDSCAALCEQMETAQLQDPATIAFLHGSALSAKALMLHREGATLRALRLLMSARGQFQTAIDANPRFYDAYLGRGAYRYGAATNASLLSWLPWIPSAESGWKDMWLAVDSSRFSKYSALSALVWFVIKNRDYALADSICDAGLARFPECRNFLWPRLALNMKQKRWAKAKETAQDLLTQYLKHPQNNGYDVTGLYATLMTCADSLHHPDQAVAYAHAGIAAFRTPDVTSRRKEKLRLMEERIEQEGAARREGE